MRKILHPIYKFIGHVFCKICLIYWDIRDTVSPPKETAVLFVAHPDDDTLFFHTFIKEHCPYVCLMTTGWSLRRLPCFFRAMRQYGVRFRAYDMLTRDTRTELLEKHAEKVFKLGRFSLCATHSASGEYGHEMHRRVHDAVVKKVDCPVFVPVSAKEITEYPLPDGIAAEKEDIFNTIYTTEKFVLDQYAEWVSHEKLIEENL